VHLVGFIIRIRLVPEVKNNWRKKVNLYLSSLMIKVPDHVYVLGHSYTCYTYCCYAYHFYAYRLYFINVSICNVYRILLSFAF
jgi:hypothetical protein